MFFCQLCRIYLRTFSRLPVDQGQLALVLFDGGIGMRRCFCATDGSA